MSLISSGVSLIHRCDIERNENVDTPDSWGNPIPPEWQTNVSDVHCRGWTATHDTVTNKSTIAVIIEIHLLVPLGTDVTDEDRVPAISHRGQTIFEGPWAVHAVLRRRDFLELILAKAS